jgi:hypothetical protein
MGDDRSIVREEKAKPRLEERPGEAAWTRHATRRESGDREARGAVPTRMPIASRRARSSRVRAGARPRTHPRRREKP